MKKFLTAATFCTMLTAAAVPAFAGQAAVQQQDSLQAIALDDNTQIVFSQQALSEIQKGNAGTLSVTYTDENGKTQTFPVTLTKSAEKLTGSLNIKTEDASQDGNGIVTIAYTDENGNIQTVSDDTLDMTALETPQNISLEKK